MVDSGCEVATECNVFRRSARMGGCMDKEAVVIIERITALEICLREIAEGDNAVNNRRFYTARQALIFAAEQMKGILRGDASAVHPRVEMIRGALSL